MIRSIEAPAAASASGRLSLGTIKAGAGDHEHGDAFSDGRRCISGEVQQVRPGSDQNAVEPGILGGVGCSPVNPLCVTGVPG